MEVSYNKKKIGFILKVYDMEEFIEMQVGLRAYMTTIDEWIKSYEGMDDQSYYGKDKKKELEKLRDKKRLVQSLLNDFKETVY